VKDRQTIVIGGLISDTKTKNSKGVPGLSRLPFIGFLFGEKKNNVVKNELIIMITPKVITSLNDIDSVSKEFTEKFYGLKRHKRIIEFLSE
jgi:general secretion pathway protein D